MFNTESTLLVLIPYAVIAVGLTMFLARQLSKHGAVFLRSVFPEKPDFAAAVNQLLVIGFYLVNLGWSLLLLQANEVRVGTPTEAMALLSTRLGTLLLLLGLAHMANLYIFHRVGRSSATPHTVRL
ncbi:MAG TPA: hypothetical protein VGM90_02730 [Kofleriaceae bacterium]